MWLLPALPPVCRVAARVYYRLRISGGSVPRGGPALLVANHPNALLDPLLVVAAAGRPVRFLAKAPLFSDRRIGWLMRAAGSIPVYRRSDDPSQMERNQETFREVHDALASGAAVGIFPEGRSHGDPSINPLKTGAARIALGAFALVGRAFPIIPIGLVLRQKDAFRSDAAVIIGAAVTWLDLGPRGVGDARAVAELTERIDDGLRAVTVNLERWADGPLVECALRVWESERAAAPGAAARVSRLETTARLLARVRADPTGRWAGLVADVGAHCRRLARLGLVPADLVADVGAGRGLRWSASRLWLLLLPALACAALGFVVFWLPYRITARIVAALNPDEVARSTYKLLAGSLIYALWLSLLGLAAWLLGGAIVALGVVIALPLVGLAGQAVRERWLEAFDDARRFFLLRSRRPLVRSLRERQACLATRLRQLHEEAGN